MKAPARPLTHRRVLGIALPILPDEVARRADTGFLALIPGMNPPLPRLVI